jgi:hypothetical protein
MYLKEIQAKGIFKKRIELAKAFEQRLEKDEKPDPVMAELEQLYAGEWILMREPRGEEVIGFEAGGKPKTDPNFVTLFPDCLLDWSAKRDEKEKASREEVMAMLKESSSLWAYVLNEWGTSLPLARRSGRASVSPLAR